MNNFACIIDKNNFYTDFVVVDENNEIYFYDLKSGESLIHTVPPPIAAIIDGNPVLFNDDMMIKPKWNKTKSKWTESASAAEIEAARFENDG